MLNSQFSSEHSSSRQDGSQFLNLAGTQFRAEVEHAGQDIVGLKVRFGALKMQKPSRGKEAFFIKDKPNAPTATLNRLVTIATLGLTARRQLCAVDARQAPILNTDASGMLQTLSIRQWLKRFPKGLKDRLRPLVRCAQWVEPQRHFSFGKRIGQTFTET